MDSSENNAGGDWRSRLTTLDGSSLVLDPDLLQFTDEQDDHLTPHEEEEEEEDEDDEERKKRLEGRDDYHDSPDTYSDEEYNKYDELGRTPPRTVMAKNRKWSNDKRNSRDMDRRAVPKLYHKSGGGRGGIAQMHKGKDSPRARSRKVGQKRASYTRDILREELKEEDSDGGGSPGGRGGSGGGGGGGSRDYGAEEDEEEAGMSRSRSNTMSLGPSSTLMQPSSIRQADSLPMGYRVKTTSRYMSLSSRPIPVQANLTSSGSQTPRKRSVSEGQDRQTFYRVLSALVKSQKSKESARYEHAQDYERQPSKEETLWQNEVKEVIWLELQAWFAGRDLNEQDFWLIKAREMVDSVAIVISTFRFLPNLEDESVPGYNFQVSNASTESSATEIFYDAQESVGSARASLDAGQPGPGLSYALANLGLENKVVLQFNLSSDTLIGSAEEEYAEEPDGASMSRAVLGVEDESTRCGGPGEKQEERGQESLEVNCFKRIHRTNMALEQVQDILSKLENCESLFPSSRQVVLANPSWGDAIFKSRVKVLCMWYNLTLQLNNKIEMLGQILVGIGSRLSPSFPWPHLHLNSTRDEGIMSQEDVTSQSDDRSPIGTVGTPSRDPSCNNLLASPHKVRFKVNNDIINNSSPSDSNNSTDSGTELKPSPAFRQDSAMSGASSVSVHSESGYSNYISPYRKYVDKHLKTKGIRKTLSGLHKIIRGTLHRAKIALESPQGLDQTAAGFHHQKYHPHLEERFSSLPTPSEDDQELSQFGCWNPEFSAMNLPSFRATYLFLCRVPRDVMHECLIIRLEQKPLEPSELSIRQLMRECKEALKLAVNERQKYISRVKAAIYDVEKDKVFLENFEREMLEYDEHLTMTLDVYLEYLRNFVTMIQGDASLLISTYQKNLLEQEWDFIKSTCPHIPGGEARAGNTFCQMACGMLSAIGDFLQSGIDEIMKNMSDLSDSITEDEDMELDTQTRKQLFEAFRGFQSLFAEARERSVKAISFAKLLRKDLEVASEFNFLTESGPVLQRLEVTGHVQVIAPHSRQHLIFIPSTIKYHDEHILQLLDMHCGQEFSHQNTNQGYLVLMRHGGACEVPPWRGETKYVKPTAETTISLSQIEVNGVLLVAPSAVLLEPRRKEFAKSMKDVLAQGQEQRATCQAIADSLDEVKQGALSLRHHICQELSLVEEKCHPSSLVAGLDQVDKDTFMRRMREILQQCYKFGFEYHKELDRLITGNNSRRDLTIGIINFSMQWMRFVLEWCERGRGLRPDWAVKGIEFLYLAANPTFTKFLTDEEFTEFKKLTEKCHSHVVGDSRDTPERRPSVSPRGDRTRAGRPNSRSGSRATSPHRSVSREDVSLRKYEEMDPDRAAMPPPQSPVGPASPMGTIRRKRSDGRKSLDASNELSEGRRNEGRKSLDATDNSDSADLSFRVPIFGNLPWRERVKRSIETLESEREESKIQQQAIGRVLDKTQPEDRIHIKARLVKFSWQRGVKIGQGHFGKVYTAINNETGDIMAMKEIPLQPNDHKTLRSVADELRIFESIHHPNIINHYGVEIHREEMLIFMEYCPEGTLEALVTSTEAGIDETLVRRYTRQLLQAIACLHENQIVHRDIKGANIFLTDDMKTLKLGDFGCAVKIKAHTTMPGELQGFVGTQAYMAPEVFTRNMSEGHGRSADIWSLGCVVIEMATGNRPWAHLESNYQIMFKVGMGKVPDAPETLSEEGKNFLCQCFVHNPAERSTAEDLLSHPFTKIYEDDEVTSLPLFASVSDMSDMRRSLVRKDSGKY